MFLTNSGVISAIIQACMMNDLASIKPVIFSDSVVLKGQNKENFYSFFEKTLQAAHRHSNGDWSMTIESAEWLKDKEAVVYDFYDAKNKQPIISVVIEETEKGVWMEVLK